MTIGLGHYLTVGAILFTLGILGIFVNRKNVIVILMSVELILLAVNINFVAFSAALGDLVGQVFALFVLTVAAAEAAIGLAILVVFFRNRGSIAVEDVNMLGVFRVNTWVAFFAATGVILSAAYALWLYRKVIFGALTKENLKGMLDLSTREKVILYPLVALVIFFGVYPAPVFDATRPSVEALLNNITVSLDAAKTAAAN